VNHFPGRTKKSAPFALFLRKCVFFLPVILLCCFSGACLGEDDPSPALPVNADTIGGLADLLAAAPGGRRPERPLKLAADLPWTGANWNALLAALDRAGKYAALDLSACPSSGVPEFDPGAANTGEKYIVSLVLPDGVERVPAGGGWNSDAGRYDGTFQRFTALAGVKGAGIRAVGEFAFAGCSALEAVSFPGAADIGAYAFAYCSALTALSLPGATVIGESAFFGCNALETLSLPAATVIGESAFTFCNALETLSLPAATDIGAYAFTFCNALETVSLPGAADIGAYAFSGCTALTALSLPAATSIGERAFYGTGTTAPLTLGGTPPSVGVGMFNEVDSAKTVTVKVPSGATGYGTIPATYTTDTTTNNWGNAFRGKGWDGTSYLTGSVNSNITLNIQYITP
jgi:hypothetical protein